MKTAVITTGGLGTRLLTVTKASPKTLLPLYDRSFDRNVEPLLRPLIEIIFENLYDNGFRRFCFIVGTKNKKSILNHMVPDQESYDWFIGNYKNLNVVGTTHKTKLNPKIFKLIDKL